MTTLKLGVMARWNMGRKKNSNGFTSWIADVPGGLLASGMVHAGDG
jgi:uncharacterized membrane protein AbrB (regulator of aidB expression)